MFLYYFRFTSGFVWYMWMCKHGLCLSMCTCLLAVQNFFWKNSSFIWMPTAERESTESQRRNNWTCACSVCWSASALWSLSLQESSYRQERYYLNTHRVRVHLLWTPTEGKDTHIRRKAKCVHLYIILYCLHTCAQMLLTTLKMWFHTILNPTSLSVSTWNPSHSSLPVVIPVGISRVGIQSLIPAGP